MLKNIHYSILFLISLLVKIACINKQCKYGLLGECGNNTICLENNYCACINKYIGNCQFQTYPLNKNSLLELQINQSLTLISLDVEINNYVILQFTICHQMTIDKQFQSLSLWIDDGNLEKPTDTNSLGSNHINDIKQGCKKIQTQLYKFGSQPNGQRQIPIFGINLLKQGKQKIKISYQSDSVQSLELLVRIVLILLISLMIISAIGIIYCVYKCRRRNIPSLLNQQNPNNIEHFKQFMPSKKISNKNDQEVCSICLQEIIINSVIRETICDHRFHLQCLDSWCKKHLSCPICRMNLSQQALKKSYKQKSVLYCKQLCSSINYSTLKQDIID